MNNSAQYYTTNKYQSFIDENGYPRSDSETEFTYAKIVNNKKRKSLDNNILYPSFYIRTDPNKNILNPFDPNKNNKSFINNVCKNTNNFSEVTESIFNKYINFLKTENPTWFHNAQREIR